MSTKTRAAGFQRVVPQAPSFVIIRHDNSVSKYSRAKAPDFNRKIGEDSTISDETGTGGNFRPCNHVKHWYKIVQPNVDSTQTGLHWKLPTSPSYEKYVTCDGLLSDVHARRYGEFLTRCNATAVSVDSINWDSLSASALATMLPSFQGGNSMINFIYELKDFKGTARNLYNKIRHGDRNIGLWELFTGDRGKPPGKRRLSRRSTLRDLSTGHLASQFGWVPFFSDIQSLVTLMRKFDSVYRDYIRRANTIQSRYYGTWVPGTAQPKTLLTSGVQGPQGGWAGNITSEVAYYIEAAETQGVRYHACMRYRYPMPGELATAGGRNRALLDSLGLGFNPSHIWNMVPWTFAIDWLVNVSDYLDRMKQDNVRFQTEILDFCHSAKMQRAVTLSLNPSNQIPNIFTPYYPNTTKIFAGKFVTDSCIKSHYKRLVGKPNLLGAITTSGLSLREFTLSGALLGVRRKPRP